MSSGKSVVCGLGPHRHMYRHFTSAHARVGGEHRELGYLSHIEGLRSVSGVGERGLHLARLALTHRRPR